MVRGLLESHGVPTLVIGGGHQDHLPVAPRAGHGDVKLSVPSELADEARRLIESFREDNEPGPRVVPLRDEFAALEARVGYRFRDRGLLEHALTHRSRAHEDVTGGVVDNESLEFLGDAVLGLVVADALYREYPQLDEGEKSKIKAALVSAGSLARRRRALDLGTHLLLGRGEEKTGGRRKAALLADACEALIAAVYLDGGLEPAREFIRRELWGPLARGGSRGTSALTGDFKSALQEKLQAGVRGLPEYRTVGERGPDHDKVFEVELRVGGDVAASATGRTKKEAEQEAARRLLVQLEQEADGPLRSAAQPLSRLADLDDAAVGAAARAIRRGLGPAARRRRHHRRVRRARRPQPFERVAVRLADDVVLVRDIRPPVDTHPQPQQRVAEAIPLAVGRDEVDVLQPGEIVLRRARRAVQPLRDGGERERLVLGEDVEDGLERPVAACAVQPQLVAEAAAGGQLAIGPHRRGERADGVERTAGPHQPHLRDERADIAGMPVDERGHAPGEIVRFGVPVGGDDVANLADRERSHRQELDPIAGQLRPAAGPVLEAGAQHEAVRAVRDGARDLGLRLPQAGKALEGADLEDLVEEERRPAAVRVARVHQEGEERIEGLPGTVGRHRGGPEGGPRGDDGVAALRRHRDALEIDVLARGRAERTPEPLQTLGASGTAAADEQRDAAVGSSGALEQLMVEAVVAAVSAE